MQFFLRTFVERGSKKVRSRRIEQEAQLPQRNSASAAHVFLGWLINRAIHWTPSTKGHTSQKYPVMTLH